MEVRCSVCGKTYNISKAHKDYKKMVRSVDQGVFICEQCSKKLSFEAAMKNDIWKNLPISSKKNPQNN
ncbi:MAG: hypothetical protein RR396_00215 [Clostridiales bacterium]